MDVYLPRFSNQDSRKSPYDGASSPKWEPMMPTAAVAGKLHLQRRKEESRAEANVQRGPRGRGDEQLP